LIQRKHCDCLRLATSRQIIGGEGVIGSSGGISCEWLTMS
jgi:hypothetical protein